MKVVCKSKDTITLLIQQILVDFQNQGKSAGPWIWSWTYVYLLYCNIAQLFIFWKLLLEALLSILDNFNFYNYWKMYINEIMTVCSLNLNTQNSCLFVNHNSRTYPGRRCPRYCLGRLSFEKKQAEKLKSREMKVEWWRLKDEWWMMKDDDFKLLKGFCD